MKLIATTLLSITTAGLAFGGSFSFSSRQDPPDVLMGIRKKGSSSEIGVDLGSILTYSQATPGSSFLVTNASPSEITKIFPVLDGVQITIFAAVVKTTVAAGNPIFRTLWLSNPRTDSGTQSTPWATQIGNAQGPVANRIGTIGDNMATYSKGQPVGPDNNGVLVLLPANLSYGYSANMGPIGNFNNTFYDNAELTLPTDYVTTGVAARLDFYELTPAATVDTTQDGKYLGYFEFGTDATLTFHAASDGLPPSTPPQISGISYDGATTSVTVATLAGGYQYSLLRAPAGNASAPVAQWTVVSPSVVGTGNPVTLSDSNGDVAGFYRVQVLP